MTSSITSMSWGQPSTWSAVRSWQPQNENMDILGKLKQICNDLIVYCFYILFDKTMQTLLYFYIFILISLIYDFQAQSKNLHKYLGWTLQRKTYHSPTIHRKITITSLIQTKTRYILGRTLFLSSMSQLNNNLTLCTPAMYLLNRHVYVCLIMDFTAG